MNTQAAVLQITGVDALRTFVHRISAKTQPVEPQLFEIDGRFYFLSIASSRAEREEAYRLVFETYKAQGFADSDDTGLWYSIHNALPGTVTFLVRDEAGQAVASGTVVPDSPFGLPLERMYQDEVAALRRSGRRMCEINSLVSSAAAAGWAGRSIILKVFSAAFSYARDILGADDLVCVTSPEHARFYRRVLLLDEIGPLRGDPHANGAASVALRLDTATAEQRFRDKYAGREDARNLFRFFRPSPEEVAECVRWIRRQLVALSEEDFHHFFFARQDLLQALGPEEIQCLRDAYPEFGLWAIEPTAAASETPEAACWQACCANSL